MPDTNDVTAVAPLTLKPKSLDSSPATGLVNVAVNENVFAVTIDPVGPADELIVTAGGS